jgi:hypothetical protein
MKHANFTKQELIITTIMKINQWEHHKIGLYLI